MLRPPAPFMERQACSNGRGEATDHSHDTLPSSLRLVVICEIEFVTDKAGLARTLLLAGTVLMKCFLSLIVSMSVVWNL